ncbi:MAG TPA: amidohydrolase family protein [Candidatus Binatus sp.]|nr:amidohydrolase family protein [Candidatus Binatus sp.]
MGGFQGTHLDVVFPRRSASSVDRLLAAAARMPWAWRLQSVGLRPPRLPVVDAHSHLNSAFAGAWRGRPAREVVAALDRANVRCLVDMDGGHGEGLSAEIARLQAPYPDRIAVFAGIDSAKIRHDPDFGATEAARLVDSVRRGARGLKIWKSLGLSVVDPAGRLLALDDARLDPLWHQAARLSVPVVIHIADPASFFEPVDERNERSVELRRHPEWSYLPTRPSPAEPGFPSRAELIDQFVRLLGRHPETVFIGAHLASCSDDLERLSALLLARPNLHVDIAARVNELGRQPVVARRFLTTFPDRVLFGTDAGPDPRWYALYARFLETTTRGMSYSISRRPLQGHWTIDGLGLDDEVLRRLYSDNARRLIRFGE